MTVDKNYCMSSYLAFRFIVDDDKEFKEGFDHNRNKIKFTDSNVIPCKTADDIDREIKKQFDELKGKKLGLLLSGGMDSACLASYMKGMDAYTFRFINGEFGQEELKRAETYAKEYEMNLHYVDINWNTVLDCVDKLMSEKCCPISIIETQIYHAIEEAKEDGIELMIVGECADANFYGMDKLMSKDWTFDDFVKRFNYTEPSDVLKNPVDITGYYEPYRINGNMIDFLKFMDDLVEPPSSFFNAFKVGEMNYFDPYKLLVMADKVDLNRIRNGESKYLIRDLFRKCYPNIPVPVKVAMPRPVDYYFKDWKGPTRPEFKDNLDISKFTGNQKWQIWCLERFLNNIESVK